MSDQENGIPLFVYGTLRSDCCDDGIFPLRASMRSLGPATAPGKLFDLGSYPGLVPAGDGSVVRGELLIDDSPDAEKTLQQLDRYEGCDTADPAAGLYRRERTIATLDHDGSAIECWVYVFNRSTTHARPIDSGCWRTHRGEEIK